MAKMARRKLGGLSFEKLYEEFQNHNKTKNLRPATIKSYGENLQSLKTFMEKMGVQYVTDFTTKTVDSFIQYLQANDKINSVTINTYLRATRVFLRYAMTQEYINEFKINLIKQENTVKEIYSEEEIKKLIKKPDLKTCSDTEYRNWVLVQYFLETGNRLNTVINIKVKDVDLVSGMVVLTITKNRKQMYIPLSSTLVKVLTDYIRAFENLDNPESYLFLAESGNQMTKDSISKAIARFNKTRGVEKTSIHAFRHTFGTNYARKGGNIFKLQRLMGHSSIEVTKGYVNLTGEDLKADIDEYSILDSMKSKKVQRRA